jgi:addiction module HigA family antidote
MNIETPKISEILLEEFMIPLNVSAYKLAHSINVPVSRIQDILHDRRKITMDTSIRLGLFFGVSETYFLKLQNDIDLRNEKNINGDEYAKIIPLSPVATN